MGVCPVGVGFRPFQLGEKRDAWDGKESFFPFLFLGSSTTLCPFGTLPAWEEEEWRRLKGEMDTEASTQVSSPIPTVRVKLFSSPPTGEGKLNHSIFRSPLALPDISRKFAVKWGGKFCRRTFETFPPPAGQWLEK